jgi:hypothetical protein
MSPLIRTLLLALTLALLAIGFPAVQAQSGERLTYPSGKGPLSRDFLGIHFHRLLLAPGEKAIPTAWPPLGFGLLRLWDSRTRWADIEPRKGDWQFGRLDLYVNEAWSQGTRVLYTLGSTPAWASARPGEPCSYGHGCAAEPRSLADWEDYVRTVARRYRGRICCYEVWNEPDFSGPPKPPRVHGGFYTGTVETLVEMTRIAREVLQAEDPEALLLSPGFVNGVHNRLAPWLAAGGGQHIDAVAYHFYAWQDERRMQREIQTVREVMRQHGIAHLPLWSTEAGVEVYPDNEPLPPGIGRRINRQDAAAMLARQIVLAAFAGLDRYIYYAWDNDLSGMVDRAGQAHPARDAILLTMRWLDGLQPKHCSSGPGRPTVCWGEREGLPVAIAWNPHPGPRLQLPLPQGLHPVNWQSAVTRWPEQTDERPTLPLTVGPNPTLISFERTTTP